MLALHVSKRWLNNKWNILSEEVFINKFGLNDTKCCDVLDWLRLLFAAKQVVCYNFHFQRKMFLLWQKHSKIDV